MLSYKTKTKIVLRIVAIALVCAFTLSSGASSYATTDSTADFALAPPLATKPPCEIVRKPNGSFDVVTNTDVIESWDRETARSVKQSETLGKAFRNRWAFTDVSYLVGQMLLLTREHNLHNPKDILIPLIKKHIRNRDGEAELLLEGINVDEMQEVREGNEITGFALPVTRNGTPAYRLVYNLRGGETAVQMKEGVNVYVSTESITSEQETTVKNVFEQFTQPKSLQEGIKEGEVKRKILTQEEKDAIYKEARNIFSQSRLAQALKDIGVDKYILYVVSGMSPQRVAVRDHSDLDLAFAVSLDSQQKFEQVIDAIRGGTALGCITTENLGSSGTVVRLKPNTALLNLGVVDTVDVFVQNINTTGNRYTDKDTLLHSFYQFNMPIANILSLKFSIEEERQKLQEYLMTTTNEDLIPQLKNNWLDCLAVDYYHLSVAGVEAGQRSSPSHTAQWNQLIREVETALTPSFDEWDSFKRGLERYYEETARLLMMPSEFSFAEKKRSLENVAHRETGNFDKIKNRLLLRQAAITPERIKQALAYYKHVCDTIKTGQSAVGTFYLRIRDNPVAGFDTLAGRPLFWLFTESSYDIIKEFGMPREQIILCLTIDLIMSEEERVSARSSASGKSEYVSKVITTPVAISPETERIHTTNVEDTLTYIQTQPQSQPLIVALGTSWIKGYEKGRYLQYDALNPLIGSLRTYCESKGIPFVVDSDDKLLARINAERAKEGKTGAKVVVLAGENTVKSDEFTPLRNDEKNAFVVGVNNQELTTDSYIRLMEMLTLALRLSTGIEVSADSTPIRIMKDYKLHIYIFIPHAEPMNYEQLKQTYEVQKFA